jgi:SAM-dependent methyltransferase
MMAEVTSATVRAHFEAESRNGRRLLPDTNTASGWGTYLKYAQAASLMADPHVADVLDIGCNRGSIEALFHRNYPEIADVTRVEGIDVSAAAIAQANELGLPNCNFGVYDGSVLPYPDECFDLVIMVEVIEHVLEKEQLLAEIRRTLRPGGKLFLTTPNPQCWTLKAQACMWYLLRAIFRRPQPAKDAYICHERLRKVLSTAGFRSVQPGSFYAWPHLYVSLLGWSLLPPLPPKALYHYQRICFELFGRDDRHALFDRRFKWSLVALLQKSELPLGVLAE